MAAHALCNACPQRGREGRKVRHVQLCNSPRLSGLVKQVQHLGSRRYPMGATTFSVHIYSSCHVATTWGCRGRGKHATQVVGKEVTNCPTGIR